MSEINPDYYKNTNCQSSLIVLLNIGEFDFSLGNAIKYIYRAGKKSDDIKTDIQKAVWYLENFIKYQTEYLTKNIFIKNHRNVLNEDYVIEFVNNSEITLHQKEWLYDLLCFKQGQDQFECNKYLNSIKNVLYSIKCYLNQQDLL